MSIGNEHLGWGNSRAEKLAIAAEFLGRPVPDVEAPDWRLWIDNTTPTFLVQGAGTVDGRAYWLRCRDGSTEINIASAPGLNPFGDPEAVQIEWDANESWGRFAPYEVRVGGQAVDVAHGQGLRDAVNYLAETMGLERWARLAGGA